MDKLVKLAFVGDVMCGDFFSLLGEGAAAVIDKYGYNFLDSNIISILKAHHIVLGNVECALSDVGRNEYSLRRLHMRGRPQTSKLLSDWGLTIANVANNHIFEHGKDAAVDTVKNLKNAGLDIIGAGKDNKFEQGFSWLKKNIHDVDIHVMGICIRNEKYAYDGGVEISEAISEIQKVKNECPKSIIIISIHWGNELIEYPSQKQREIALALKSAGANMIIGHHPHVVQGIDMDDGKLIVYSLGNFIFDGYSEATSWSMILSVTLDEQNIVSVESIPLIFQEEYRPSIVTGARLQEYLKEIARRSELCKQTIKDPVLYDKEYYQRVQMLCQKSRKDLWKALLRRFFKFPPYFWPQILMRPIWRRLGIW